MVGVDVNRILIGTGAGPDGPGWGAISLRPEPPVESAIARAARRQSAA